MNTFTRSLSVLLLFALTFPYSTVAQGDSPIPVDVISADEFKNQGITTIDMLSQVVGVSTGSTSLDGDRTSGFNTQRIFIRGVGVNIVDGLNVNGTFGIRRSSTTPEGSDFSSSRVSGVAQIEIRKNFTVGDRNIYGVGSAGIVTLKQVDETVGDDIEIKTNEFNYMLGVGSQFQITKSEVFTLAEVGYFNHKTTNPDSDNEETWSGACVQAGLTAFFNENLDIFHKGNGSHYPQGRFETGSWVIDGSTKIMAKIGGEKQTWVFEDPFTGDTEENEEEYSRSEYSLRAGTGYYLADGVAGLASLSWKREGFSGTQEDFFTQSDVDFSQSESKFTLKVGARVHGNVIASDNLRNLFVDAKVGFGSEGQSSEYDGHKEDDSEGFSRFGIKVGGIHFVSPNVALFGTVGFDRFKLDKFGRSTIGLRTGLQFYPDCNHNGDGQDLL